MRRDSILQYEYIQTFQEKFSLYQNLKKIVVLKRKDNNNNNNPKMLDKEWNLGKILIFEMIEILNKINKSSDIDCFSNIKNF